MEKITKQKFIFVDINLDMTESWQNYFGDIENAEVHKGDIMSFSGDVLVSPANSFGYMTGGVDGVYTSVIGPHLQQRVQKKITDEFDGELLVGQSALIETDNDRFPYMLSVPTMRVPSNIGVSPNVFLAARAMFLFARANPQHRTFVVPGFGTGVGGVYPNEAARVMRLAYDKCYLGNYWYKNPIHEYTKLDGYVRQD